MSPEDFYWEDGKVVLTERFHRRRGYCCGSGCRHCPFGHERVPEATRLRLAPPHPFFEAPPGGAS